MVSTFTTRLRLDKQGTGDNSGTWGTVLNRQLDLLDEGLAGLATIAHDNSASGTVLTTNSGTSDQARNMILDVDGTLTASRDFFTATISKLYVVRNTTSGGFDIWIKTLDASSTGVNIPASGQKLVFTDGTDFFEVPSDINGVVLQSPEIVSGTMSGSVLSNVTMSGGTATGVEFSGGTVSGASIEGGTVSGAAIEGGTVSGLTSPLAIGDGGTTATTASGARSSLGVTYASQAEMETGTATDRIVGAGTQHFHPGAIKCWYKGDPNDLTTATDLGGIDGSYGIDAVQLATASGANGNVQRVFFSVEWSAASTYGVLGVGGIFASGIMFVTPLATTQASGSIDIKLYNFGGADSSTSSGIISVAFLGDF